jgi:hypothetical protein
LCVGLVFFSVGQWVFAVTLGAARQPESIIFIFYDSHDEKEGATKTALEKFSWAMSKRIERGKRRLI